MNGMCADVNTNEDGKDAKGEGLNGVCADVNVDEDGKDNEGRMGGIAWGRSD